MGAVFGTLSTTPQPACLAAALLWPLLSSSRFWPAVSLVATNIPKNEGILVFRRLCIVILVRQGSWPLTSERNSQSAVVGHHNWLRQTPDVVGLTVWGPSSSGNGDRSHVVEVVECLVAMFITVMTV